MVAQATRIVYKSRVKSQEIEVESIFIVSSTIFWGSLKV